jgi:hypothetical protein
VETDEFGAIQSQPVHFAFALHGDQTVSALVLDRAFRARLDGQFLGGEKLFAIDFAIDDPAVGAAFACAPVTAIGSR